MFNSPYEYYNNTILCVRANYLYEEAKIISYSNYKKLTQRGSLNVIRNARGKFNYALVEFKTMRQDIKDALTSLVKPSTIKESMLNKFIEPDTAAAKFYVEYQDETGKSLKPSLQKQYTVNVIILKAIQKLHDELMVEIYTRGGKKSQVYSTIAEELDKIDTDQFKHSLPSSWRGIKRKLDAFQKDKYFSMIHGNLGNDNTLKIKGDIANWILAYYSLPTKPSISEIVEVYNDERRAKGWPKLTDQAVSLWLQRPENRRIWYLGRHGEEAYKNEYSHKLTIDKAQWFPNVFWAIDGTKLDWIHYKDSESGIAAQLKIDPVVDVYSEKIIGWSISETESMNDHFAALKMACNNAGVRPYLIEYDNQSGHKSSRMQRLYTDIVAKDGGTHYPNKAYSHANPIEQLFSRLQQQVLNKLWFSDKQSIKAKKLDSHPNTDFIKANEHLLYSKDQLIEFFTIMVQEWNESEHPKFKGQSRSEVYTHQMKRSEAFDVEELSTIFWLNETKPITYRTDGIKVRTGGETYLFEVYDKDGNVDIEFRRKYIGERFVVKYDPENLDAYIKLYHVDHKEELRFVSLAQPKRKHINIPLLHTEETKTSFLNDYQIRSEELERDRMALVEVRNSTGITPDRVIEDTELMMKFGGNIPKEIRSAAEGDITTDDIYNRI